MWGRLAFQTTCQHGHRGEVVGLDISEGYINKLRKFVERDGATARNLVFRLGNAGNILYPDNYFNYAVSSASFSFWSEPGKGLAEIRRVLKPGGKLYIADVYKEGPIGFTISVKIVSLFLPFKENFYSSQEFREFFQRAGFTEVYQKEIMGMLLTVGTKK